MQRMAWRFGVLAVPLVLIAGCPLWPLPIPPDGPGDAPEAYLIGTLAGVTADEIHDFVELAAHGGEADAPVIIAGAALAELDGAQQAAIKAAFDAHEPIVAVHVGEDEITLLRQILELEDQPFELPEGVFYAEVYAVDLEQDGSAWQATWLPPETTAPMHTVSHDITLADGSMTTVESEAEHAELPPDSDEFQDARMLAFVDWLSEDGARADTPLAQAAKQQAAAQASSNSLTDLASAFVDQVNFQQEGNNYTLSHFIYSCHSLDNGNDWFFVQQYCVLNGSGAYKTNEGMKKGKYIAIIETEAIMNSYSGNGTAVGLIQSSPQTANNVTTVTSGVEFQLGGSLSYGKDGPEAGISAGMTISNSKSVNVQDIKTLNQSGSTVNNARWRYESRLCDIGSVGDCFFQNCITSPPDLAVNSFQPLNQWIWRMSPTVRSGDRTMRVYFGSSLAMSEEKWYFFYAKLTHSYSGFGRYHYITLPFPPIPQN